MVMDMSIMKVNLNTSFCNQLCLQFINIFQLQFTKERTKINTFQSIKWFFLSGHVLTEVDSTVICVKSWVTKIYRTIVMCKFSRPRIIFIQSLNKPCMCCMHLNQCEENDRDAQFEDMALDIQQMTKNKSDENFFPASTQHHLHLQYYEIIISFYNPLPVINNIIIFNVTRSLITKLKLYIYLSEQFYTLQSAIFYSWQCCG